jgi:hypothetical protein
MTIHDQPGLDVERAPGWTEGRSILWWDAMRRALLLLILARSLYCENFSGFEGLCASTGSDYSSRRKSAIGLDLDGCALMFNTSVECFYSQRDIEDKRISIRTYAGLGFGPNLQVQGGIGNGGPSLRIRSTIDLALLLKDPASSWQRFPAIGFTPKGREWGGEMRDSPVLTLYGEALNREFRVGVLFGILFW